MYPLLKHSTHQSIIEITCMIKPEQIKLVGSFPMQLRVSWYWYRYSEL